MVSNLTYNTLRVKDSQGLHLSHEMSMVNKKPIQYFNHVIKKSNYPLISSLVISMLITVPFCRE